MSVSFYPAPQENSKQGKGLVLNINTSQRPHDYNVFVEVRELAQFSC